uniref:Reverse transcriptase zinc-binding domain-containing protein n=1 Tax=Setaria viridis TaxID=4556 RepID=A0A4U6VMI3_SETVI|nr:hypothetical protein SEVIR_2G022800v2 [Setaria viridis]
MELDSYTCELCILQKMEKMEHLFFRCNFAKSCWRSIGISFTPTRTVMQILKQIRNRLDLPFSIEIIILMTWSISTMRNDWMFNNINPIVQRCKMKFTHEFSMLRHRVKQTMFPLRASALFR